MKTFIYASTLLLSTSVSAFAQKTHLPVSDPNRTLRRIAFGSCAHQDKPQPILEKVVEMRPDLFIYLGDNIYGDTEDMEQLKRKYEKLGSKKEFQALRNTCPILATWDDHDFGANDAGRRYCCKETSKELFLDFWREPADSERRRHKGIYHAVYYGKGKRRVQVILLDTRTFRDDLLHCSKGRSDCKNDYLPNPSPDSTFLGAEQWAWLEQTLRQPAALRIIASSNQFAHEYNGWESWTNVPHERQRMLDLIQNTKAGNVVFLSGDVHWGEISVLHPPGMDPIYDITSSGITQTWPNTEPNENRIGEPVRENNFGWIEIDWNYQPPLMTFRLYDVKKTVRVEAKEHIFVD